MKFSRHVWMLVALYLLIVAINGLWFVLDDRPPVWDMAVHLATAFDLYDALKHFSFSWASVKSLLLVGKFYPTLFPALMAIFFLLLHPSIYAGAAANCVPLAVLMVSTYRLGRKLFSENTGLLAAFLVVTYPIMAWLAREALLDFSQAAMVAAAAWIYLETENFSKCGPSIAYGLVFALGFLTKHGFIFYALSLGLLALVELAMRDAAPRRPRAVRLAHLAAAHLIGIAGAALWYVPHWADVREYILLNRQLHYVFHQPEFMTAPSMLYTLDALTRVQMLCVPFLFLLWGVVISVRRWGRRALILYFGGFLSLVIMTLTIVHREVRMSVASLSFFAVLTAAGIFEIRAVRWRRLALIVLVTGAALEYELITFGLAPWPDSVSVFKSAAVEVNLLAQSYARLTGPPRREDWKIVPILKAVEADAARENLRRRLGFVPDLARFNHFDFILYTKLDAIPVAVERVAGLDAREPWPPTEYLLLKSGAQGEPGTTPANGRIAEFVAKHPEMYLKIGTFTLPDQSQAELYRRRVTGKI